MAGHPAWVGLSATIASMVLAGVAGCVVKQHCFGDEDCPGEQSCLEGGECGFECVVAEDCDGLGLVCEHHHCVLDCAGRQLECPEGAVSICGQFCVDAYEASRVDANELGGGSDETMAVSQPGVIPWYSADPISGMNQAIAAAACAAAGKRLCTASEWEAVCRGLDRTEYVYGDVYDPLVCNGIDTYCTCDGGEIYPHCYLDCGADFHVEPTGSFPACDSGFGVMDVNGNVWEVVDSTDGLDHYRGGAYNCRDSEKLHACGYEATWNPSAKGFRCCADGEPAR